MQMETQMISKPEKKLSRKYSTEVPNEVVEEQTKKVPNLLFLGIAGAAIAASAALTLSKRPQLGNFIGLWVPSILILGLYNKMVKVEDEVLDTSVTHH